MPGLLMLVAFPLGALAFACGLGAACHEAWRERPLPGTLRVGAAAWWGLLGFGFVASSLVTHDWTHLSWGVGFPLLGLFAASGVVLAARGPEGAAAARRPLRVALALIALAAFPVALIGAGLGPDAGPVATGRPWVGLAEAAHHGFGGPLPEPMEPRSDAAALRGFGPAPREFTLTLATTGNAAVLVALLAAVVLLARSAPPGALRTALLVVGPPVALAATWLVPIALLWRNDATGAPEPGLVQSYGPWCVAAAIALAALALLALLALLAPRAAAAPESAAPSPDAA